jgi:nucleotide-binding universal stress UspA family protein
LTEIQPKINKTTGTTISYQIHQDQITSGKNSLEKVKKLFDEANISIETRLINYKEPSEYIKEKVKEEGFDLVILGCKGEHSRVQRVMGTVPENVLEKVPCDVLIVK